MRTWLVVAGLVSFALGVAAVIGGGSMSAMATYCDGRACDDSATIAWSYGFGRGLNAGGWLLGLGGVALVAAGILVDRPRASA